MDQDFLVRTLGLTEEEAFLLLRVVARGQLTAAAAARLMGKSRGRAYEILRRLVSEGLLEELPGRPLLYAARPLADAIAGKRGELEARMAALRQAEDTFRRTEAALRPAGPGGASLYWGVRAINKEAARMAQQAQEAVVVAGSASFGDAPGFELLLLSLAKARLAGASVVVFLSDRPEAAPFREQVERTLGAGHVVAYDAGLMRDLSFFAADGEVLQCLPGAHGEDEEAEEALGVKVRGPAFGAFMRSALQALLNPRRGLTPDESFAAFKEVVAHARREVCTLAGQGWTALRPEAETDDVAALYAQAAARGVAVRAVVDPDTPTPGAAGRLGPGETRVRPGLPLWLAIVDDAAAFQVQRSESGELAAHLSKDLSVVRLYRTLFENFWKDSKPPSVQGLAKDVRR
jgi:sugar-specific transcriptional regulator TrmB